MRALLICLLLLSLLLPAMPLRGQQAARSFPQTGHTLRGAFKVFWETHGGLASFGYPISDELWEDGRLVQYFERNRFEYHPHNPDPYKVLLGRLGEERLRSSGRIWQHLRQGRPQQGCQFFSKTGHSLCGAFKAYWEAHGGLALFGYPLTEPALERSETDGRTYLVQYFERNRFEYHPENPPAYQVLLGLLGSWRAGWLLGPAGKRPAHHVRAAISGPRQTVGPLERLELTVAAPGYTGPAELSIFDAAGRLQARLRLSVESGVARAWLTSGGALGPHAALLTIDGQPAGASSAAYVLDAHTELRTGQPAYDDLLQRVRWMLAQDISEYLIDGYRVRGYRSPDSMLLWLRDHVYQALGYRYFERDMTSLLDYFRRAQHADGSFDDYVANPPWGMIKGRQQVEADLEFLFVQGVYQAWQATGDDGWLQVSRPAMERGMAYSTSHPHRWDPGLGLVKRPFTIDTWDFEYGGPTIGPDGQPSPRHWIDHQTRWGIMHGDNTGLAYAMKLLGRMHQHGGDAAGAARWHERANSLLRQLNAVSWNGAFFTHQIHLTPVTVPGVDESRQLSLSNAYALNREVLSQDQASAIIAEYRRRGQAPGAAFAEWYSIDPPFPAGSFGTRPEWGNEPGQYVNGGIMPLVGGELARGAFSWGFEEYGLDILRRYYQLIITQGGSYLWYHADGRPGLSSIDSLSTDGWGSSAMLAALIEGAAGIVDRGSLFRQVDLAPRWAADQQIQQASAVIRYPASYGYLAYRWQRQPDGLRIELTGSLEQGRLRLLLPPNTTSVLEVRHNDQVVPYQQQLVGASRYVDLSLTAATQTISVRWK